DPDQEENPGDLRGHTGNPHSAEGARHQSDNKAYQCVINHLGLHLLCCLTTRPQRLSGHALSAREMAWDTHSLISML
ncbi:MAG: hypothetical protein ACRERE_31455, partial [Candidatus Entotheonellia bacterium]